MTTQPAPAVPPRGRGAITRRQQAAIDEADASIAVLGPDGVVVAVNRRWAEFGRENGRPGATADIGRPYPVEPGSTLGEVIAGRAVAHSFVYPCHSPSEQRWFRGLAVRVESPGGGRVIVVHLRLSDAPSPDDMTRAADELTLRWGGARSVCAWCQRRRKDPLGNWVDGSPEPGQRYSHGICPECLSRFGLDG